MNKTLILLLKLEDDVHDCSKFFSICKDGIIIVLTTNQKQHNGGDYANPGRKSRWVARCRAVDVLEVANMDERTTKRVY
jgi:hypothetical protein